MGLETASYIKDLNSSNPLSTDSLGQTDDHIRLIKAVLKNTFPNLDGAVTASPNDLNSPIPMGVITLWYGSDANVPAGWAICNGQTVARSDGGGNITTPDLRNRTVFGASSTNPQGTTAGSTTGTTDAGGAFTTTFATSVGGAHAHGGATAGHALTVGQLPYHQHATAGNGAGGGLIRIDGNFYGSTNNYILSGDGNTPAIWTAGTGNNEPHTHGIILDGNHAHNVTVSVGNHTHTFTHLPPYMSLHFIMKV